MKLTNPATDRAFAQHIANLLAPLHGIDAEDIMNRNGPTDPRYRLARYRLYQELRMLGWSYPRIGAAVGRDHTTILMVLRQRLEERWA